MRVYFKKLISEQFSELNIYSSSNPLPLTLKLKNLKVLPETIYTRNLAGENFIEFRFNHETKELYEITIVAIQEDTVKLDVSNQVVNNVFFECYIEDKGELDISKPIRILRSDSELHFFWGEQPKQSYAITENCILGIDNDNNLCQLSFVKLNNQIINEILGF